MHTEIIEVASVHEVNNCVGMKQIWITGVQKADEHYAPSFRLNSAWLSPEYKLQLATVTPGDRVKVVYNTSLGDLGVMGDFVEIVSTLGDRASICQCFTHLVSDGNLLRCPNPNCSLTLAAKFERLSGLKFVLPEKDGAIGLSINPGFLDRNIDSLSDSYYVRPFQALIKGEFWGQPGRPLWYCLENQGSHPATPQTFIVESDYKNWLNNTPYLNNQMRLTSLFSIEYFHGAMDELFQRRDTENTRQNFLMVEWLWSLGIESLTRYSVERMVFHERNFADTLESVLFYTWLITQRHELMTELDMTQYEAQSVVVEVMHRKVELFDIFKHFCSPHAVKDLISLFEKLG